MNGWWKFHRKMLDHAVWGLPGDQVKVWLTLCSNVNVKEGEWFDGKTRVVIPPGSYITSQDHIAKDAKVGRQTVRTAIKNLLRLESISTKIVTNRYTIITVVNWPIYSGEESQPNQLSNQPLTNHQPTANQPLTTTEEGKKEEKERIVISALNKEAGTNWKCGRRYSSGIHARLAEGFTIEDLLRVIAFKAKAWKNDDAMRQYLTPVTLFRKSNFERYLDECRGPSNGHGIIAPRQPALPEAWKCHTCGLTHTTAAGSPRVCQRQ